MVLFREFGADFYFESLHIIESNEVYFSMK